MALYQITPLGSNFDQIGAAIKEKFAPEDRFELQQRAGWIVSFKGTSNEVSNLIGITHDDENVKTLVGSALVTPLVSYYGRGPTNMWEWLRNKLEGAN